MMKKKRHESSNLTQEYLNELNKTTLPGYEHYDHSPHYDYDADAAWHDRYYAGAAGNRYKVLILNFPNFLRNVNKINFSLKMQSRNFWSITTICNGHHRYTLDDVDNEVVALDFEFILMDSFYVLLLHSQPTEMF